MQEQGALREHCSKNTAEGSELHGMIMELPTKALRQHAEAQQREGTRAVTQAGLLDMLFQMEAKAAQAHTDCQVQGVYSWKTFRPSNLWEFLSGECHLYWCPFTALLP